MTMYPDMHHERRFQDELWRLGLITRIESDLGATDILRPHTKELKLYAFLIENPGYILPYLFLSTQLYASKQNNMAKIGRLVTELKNKQVVHGWDVFALAGYGIGIGIESLSFTTKQLQLLKLLWDRQEHTAVQIHQALWRVRGPSTAAELYKVRTLIDTTRDILAHTPLRIVRDGQWRQYHYVLHDSGEKTIIDV